MCGSHLTKALVQCFHSVPGVAGTVQLPLINRAGSIKPRGAHRSPHADKLVVHLHLATYEQHDFRRLMAGQPPPSRLPMADIITICSNQI